jgi:hypothetical protein
MPVAWLGTVAMALVVMPLPGVSAAQSPAVEPELRYREMRRAIDRPVDQGFVDRSPIGTSLKRLPSDLSVGRSFDRLYQDSLDPQRFRRIQGGLSVVFPRSVYTADDQGTIAVVPPGSVFRIGDRESPGAARTAMPPPSQRIASLEGVALPGWGGHGSGQDLGEQRRPGSNSRRLDARPLVAVPIEGRILQVGEIDRESRIGFGDPVELFIASPDPELPAILADSGYRRSRVEQLLLEAVAVTP